jgi:DNA polymerase III delta prime subunit
MGSVIVEAMASSTLAPEPKKLHPFFTAPKALPQDPASANPDADPTSAAAESTDSLDANDALARDSDFESPESSTRQRKRRKPAEDAEEDGADNKKPRRGRKKNNAQAASIMNHFVRREGDDHTKMPNQTLVPKNDTNDTVADLNSAGRPKKPLPNTDKDAVEIQMLPKQELKESGPGSLSKKVLRFNPATGTLGSPPKPKEPKPAAQQENTEIVTGEKSTPTPRGRKRLTRIVKVGYGTDDASRKLIGTKIDGILGIAVPSTSKQQKRSSPKEPKRTQQASTKAKMEPPQKETHPFFSGKPQKATATPGSAIPTGTEIQGKPPPSPKRPRIFSSTPCSPKKQRTAGPNKPMPQWGVKSLGLKTPGARAPAWPWKGMLHIRGDDAAFSNRDQAASSEPLPPRKSKGNTTLIPPHEMILGNFAAKLSIPELLDAVKNIDTDSFLPPPSELRLPQKHFESGLKLQKRILPELKNAKHDALAGLRRTLATSLSAFDRYQCESTSWAQKYAPAAAVEVLQHGKEAFLLREWLQALKVQAVDTGDVKPKSVKGGPPKKRRKKNKADDFIVDSDEEANEMDEVSDPDEEDWSPDRRGGKKTVIRAGDTQARDSKGASRLTNTVVISGPHGCGKTAAVYAIAKELDFEVFEINPGSRRSGKDVLDKIGDMTRNHLVQHQQAEAKNEPAINDEDVAEDIKSGKQATMASFFKPNQTPKQPPKVKKPAPKDSADKVEVKKSSPKNQKQSLILLDEIDVLYEEDKNFWSTVIGLIAQSKRPFVLTCNDEKLVPFQTLSLHGIFRFSEPPKDLAVDRLLMIAACEGHALRRSAVTALFETRLQDLRACLADLNYWCQIAVGDRRSGVDWYYPRYPRGCDIDEEGNTIRVVSQDTYLEGMGWLAHDVLAEQEDEAWVEDELLQEAWNNWQMDVSDWQDTLDMTSWASQLETLSREDRLAALAKYDDFVDAMSIADLCSSAMAHAGSHDETVDCTLPDITAKTREDYILGRELLDAPIMSTFDPLASMLPISLKILARRNLSTCYPSPGLAALDEATLTSKIRQHMSQPTATEAITRDDLNLAFDPLAASEKTNNSPSSTLEASVFDHTLAPIVEDVAPYVRWIVTYDNELQKQRLKMSNLLSKGGTKKRMRNTRAAHAALEGGSRTHTRPERWFKADVNGVLVMRTAGQGWVDAVKEVMVEGSEAGESTAGRAKDRARKVVDDDESSDELGRSPSGSSNGSSPD